MRWFFVEDIKADDSIVRIAGAEFTHLKKVLRLTPGSAVSVFNGRGLKLSGRIDSMDGESAVMTVEGSTLNEGESGVDLTLVQGLLKGDKPELIVQKTTELGVKGVCFYSAPRTVPDLNEEKARERVRRWRRVAIEAAKQCGRTIVPSMDYVDFASALERGGDGVRVVLWENERSQGIGDILERCKGAGGGAITLLVGPEGGFSADDLDEAVKKGFIPASLGGRVLRAETAAIAGVSIIQHRLGDLG